MRLARARGKPVVCFALVTNQMAQVEGDFEKGRMMARATPSRSQPRPPVDGERCATSDASESTPRRHHDGT